MAIVGGGYAGLSTALELAKHGIDAVVLEANELGFGASTRNGGAVSGGVNLGKSFTGRAIDIEGERARNILSDAADAFALIDRLIGEEQIECHLGKARPFCRRLDDESTSPRNQRRLALLNESGAIRGLYGAARAPA